MALTKQESLPFLSNEERLAVYQLLTSAATHLWSKNSLQIDKLQKVLEDLVPLTQKDPIFLAHLTSYVIKNSNSKDLAVVLTYLNSLNSADGTPFSPGSKYKKPNLRYVSAAALQTLDPKLSARVLEVAKRKYAVANYLNESSHFPTTLRTAFKKYLKYREVNLEIMKGIKKAGLGNTIKKLYRGLRLAPADEVAAILRWQQKNKKIKFEKTEFEFKGKTDLEVAELIREKRLPVLGVLGALERPISPVIAVALLEQSTGNQAVILRKTFEDAGVLKDKEVMKLFEEKIKTAKTALDRVETLTQEASEAVKQVMKDAKSAKRKEATVGLGKIFVHLDSSGSMRDVFSVATKRGAILAEMVNNPRENFKWGLYAEQGEELPLPEEFVEDAFAAVLFARTANGGTNAFALYPLARQFGADIDVQISDGAHNIGDLGNHIRHFHETNPNLPKPKVCIWVQVQLTAGSFGWGEDFTAIKRGYEANDIPVVVLKPEVLTESALVTESVRQALLGPVEIVNTIMKQELLPLPEWYLTL